MVEFIPTTFRMDIRTEREAFFSSHEGKTRSVTCINLQHILLQQQHNTGSTGFVFGRRLKPET